eukprot:940359-Prorocentrum_minimum.AAC.1
MASSRWNVKLLQAALRVPGFMTRECVRTGSTFANTWVIPSGFAQRAPVTTLCATSLVRPWRSDGRPAALPVLPAIQYLAVTQIYTPGITYRGAKTEANKVSYERARAYKEIIVLNHMKDVCLTKLLGARSMKLEARSSKLLA